MVRFFEAVIRPMLEAIEASHIVEIGAAGGDHSRLLAGWCRGRNAHLSVIDTAPRFDVANFEAEFGGLAKVNVGTSLNVLPTLAPPTVVLIDGDHNWHTVFHELQTIQTAVAQRTINFRCAFFTIQDGRMGVATSITTSDRCRSKRADRRGVGRCCHTFPESPSMVSTRT